MNTKLVERLSDLTDVLKDKSSCLGLLALGSCSDQERLDEWSDLDFFVIVQTGYQNTYLSNLDWLESCAPLAYSFRNTQDGHKIMWEDGIYAEYAVFEPDMMKSIPFSSGTYLFKRDYSELAEISSIPTPTLHQDIDFAVNEILTNLYVGLSRYHRGEKLSAFRIIQVHAIDRILAMSNQLTLPLTSNEDSFALDRRIELRHPELIDVLSNCIQGYNQIPQSAKSILNYIKTITELNPKMVSEIERLLLLTIN